MCHIILLLPIIGLSLFLLVPLPIASMIYAVLVIFSVWVYGRLMQSMHQPARTGPEALIHAKGEVLRLERRHLLIRILGEIWQAQSREPLNPGDPVEVVGVNGLHLLVHSAATIRSVVSE